MKMPGSLGSGHHLRQGMERGDVKFECKQFEGAKFLAVKIEGVGGQLFYLYTVKITNFRQILMLSLTIIKLAQ